MVVRTYISDNELLKLVNIGNQPALTDDKSVINFADLIRSHLAPTARIDLNGCDTGNESGIPTKHLSSTFGPSIARILAQSLPNIPVRGSNGIYYSKINVTARGSTTYIYTPH